jgi:hypothetical protein
MTASEILSSVKATFNALITPVAPTAAAAPAPVPAEPKSYKLQDGTEIAISQAGEIPAIGDSVMIGGAPAPEGVITLEDGSTITVDAAGIITQVSEAAPVTNDLSQALPAAAPAPSFEDRISAIESRIGQAKMEAFEAQTNEITELKASFAAAQAKVEGFEKIVTELFTLCEKLADIPTADPVTLTGAKKDRFEKTNQRDKKMENIAAAISKIKNPTTV